MELEHSTELEVLKNRLTNKKEKIVLLQIPENLNTVEKEEKTAMSHEKIVSPTVFGGKNAKLVLSSLRVLQCLRLGVVMYRHGTYMCQYFQRD